MKSYDIRKNYLDFFKSKNHTIVQSDSLIPTGDPTVLFTSAGMNQFKEKFLGKNLTYTRATSCQKCLRTGDLEKVGKTRGHHTFFEMLGNFSFGDYFKEDAIKFAWVYVTEVLKLSKENLWVTVYDKDDESYDIWKKLVGLSDSKIQKKGMDENFWPQNAPIDGPNGPCGPCSEIYFNDLEVWNLVFTQFNRIGLNQLEPLKNKNIDTGMGLERITQVIEGVENNFKTDLFIDLVKKITDVSTSADIARINAIADHIRAVTFAINDSVMPSNEGRGYVIRKLIRRSIVHLKNIGVNDIFLYKLVDTVSRTMKTPYPELEKSRDIIAGIVKKEEEQFDVIYNDKIPFVKASFAEMKNKAAASEEIIDAAFQFYDTHGIPIDMLEDCAREIGIEIPEEGFEKKLDEQRTRSRAAGKIPGEIFAEAVGDKIAGLGFKTEFIGYKTDSTDAKITALVDLKNGVEISQAKKNAEIGVILDRTPFYGESGGQVGDTGVLELGGKKIKVLDTKKFKDIFLHIIKYDSEILKGSRIIATIDKKRRENIMKNHTATHLLQHALRETLGDHIKQAGSVVDDKHLRFDFIHQNKIEPAELEKISDKINEQIFAGDKVSIKDNLKLEDAKKSGAIALFGEKYGEVVRMVLIGSFSKELCGGTHVENLKDIDYFKITSESSIASGVRRIEALTGKFAKDYIVNSFRSALEELKNKLKEINSLETKLNLKKTEPILINKFNALNVEKFGFKDLRKVESAILELKNALEEFSDIHKELLKRTSQSKIKDAKSNVDSYVLGAKVIDGTKVAIVRIDDTEPNILRLISDEIKNKLTPSSVIILGGVSGEKIVLISSVTDDLVKKGISAVNIVKSVSSILGGSGGGRADFAQAGGNKINKMDEAMNSAFEIIKKELKQ